MDIYYRCFKGETGVVSHTSCNPQWPGLYKQALPREWTCALFKNVSLVRRKSCKERFGREWNRDCIVEGHRKDVCWRIRINVLSLYWRKVRCAVAAGYGHVILNGGSSRSNIYWWLSEWGFVKTAVKTAVKIRVTCRAGIFYTRWTTVSLNRRYSK